MDMQRSKLVDNATANSATVNKDSINSVSVESLTDFSSKLDSTRTPETDWRNASCISALAEPDNAFVCSISGNVNSYNQGITNVRGCFTLRREFNGFRRNELHLASPWEYPLDTNAYEVRVLTVRIDP